MSGVAGILNRPQSVKAPQRSFEEEKIWGEGNEGDWGSDEWFKSQKKEWSAARTRLAKGQWLPIGFTRDDTSQSNRNNPQHRIETPSSITRYIYKSQVILPLTRTIHHNPTEKTLSTWLRLPPRPPGVYCGGVEATTTRSRSRPRWPARPRGTPDELTQWQGVGWIYD